MHYEYRVFENQTVNLCGNTFNECLFRGCDLFFDGSTEADVQHVFFDDCDITFGGLASKALDLYKNDDVEAVVRILEEKTEVEMINALMFLCLLEDIGAEVVEGAQK
jgi:hypothetical protein